MENIKALEKFGLSEKEAKVYLACLELGEDTASDISLKSNLPRTLIYDILEKLIDEKRIDTISEIGTNFAVSFDYVLYDLKDKSESHHSVSFSDVKTQSQK